MWIFEPIARFYNWILVMFGVEDMFLGSVIIFGYGFGVVIALIFITGKIKRLDSLNVLFLSVGVFIAFVVLPLGVLNDNLQECKKEVVVNIVEYDSSVYVFNCRHRTDMNGEYGEWKLTNVLHLETPKQNF